jgi:hypothetical protein
MGLSLDPEPFLDQGQVPVELTQQSGEMAIVLEGHDQARLFRPLLS